MPERPIGVSAPTPLDPTCSSMSPRVCGIVQYLNEIYKDPCATAFQRVTKEGVCCGENVRFNASSSMLRQIIPMCRRVCYAHTPSCVQHSTGHAHDVQTVTQDIYNAPGTTR
ncbi:hypothetical protein BDY19DRAFT_1044868 [Irpex rosettiformis]|uniref:Uncharacterized protein n=1 Tax=Irpex rosettiformis TaxID=378272 RepID=A0ACB8UIH4_9APHY|nr:hypothetical protein BDY19DRAFT_1044868 [Irpex rosettiformis]